MLCDEIKGERGNLRVGGENLKDFQRLLVTSTANATGARGKEKDNIE